MTIKTIKNKITNIAGEIGATLRGKGISTMKGIQADRNRADVLLVRKSKGKPDEGNWKDPLFRARANVSNLKTEASMRAKKLQTSDGYMHTK